MRTRKAFPSSALVAVGLMLLAPVVGCDDGESGSAQMSADIIACHLDDGSVEPGAKLHACDPQDHKKTTICHIPPGNPANAHTICVGNAAVPAHVQNHGDSIGVCPHEPPCPTPTGAGGAPGAGAGGGGGGAAGAGGAAGGPVVP